MEKWDNHTRLPWTHPYCGSAKGSGDLWRSLSFYCCLWGSKRHEELTILRQCCCFFHSDCFDWIKIISMYVFKGWNQAVSCFLKSKPLAPSCGYFSVVCGIEKWQGQAAKQEWRDRAKRSREDGACRGNVLLFTCRRLTDQSQLFLSVRVNTLPLDMTTRLL